MMKVTETLRHRVLGKRVEAELGRIHDRFAEYTMIPRDTFVDNLRLAASVAGIPGCVVECGVWRGGMAAGLATVLGPGRTYYLCDSFQGLPRVEDIDGPAAQEWQRDTTSPGYYDNCSAPPELAEKAMRLAEVPRFHLVKGWFEDTLPSLEPDAPIALLRLDADWYSSTMLCLEHLFDKVTPGGLVVLDDYYAWDGCSRALHDFLSRRKATERIRSLGEICFLQKQARTVSSEPAN